MHGRRFVYYLIFLEHYYKFFRSRIFSSYFLPSKGVMELDMKELGGKKTVFERIQFEI